MSLATNDLRYAQTVWNYMFLRQQPIPSDVIIGLGCHDLSVADDAARLYQRGLAPLVVFSGNVGRMTKGIFETPEAELMKIRAIKRGVPSSMILTECESTNTGENLRFTQALLKANGIIPKTITLVHKPYMLRRDYATFMKQWGGAESVSVSCWADDVTMDEYLKKDSINPREAISVMLGDLQRVMMYPNRGYQIEQEIPDEVRHAYEVLTKKGYDGHLLSS